MRTATHDIVKEVKRSGGILSDKQSVVKLVTGMTSLSFFQRQEISGGYPELAQYNVGGKNPIDSQDGKTLVLQLSLVGADFANLDLSAPTGTYGVLADATKFLSQLKLVITKNKDTVREVMASSIIEPLPLILKSEEIGTGSTNINVSVNAIQQRTGNLENDSYKLRIPIDLVNGDSFTIEGKLPSGGYSVGSNLNNHLLVAKLLTVEYPQGKKQ